jgi:hypothetical protein
MVAGTAAGHPSRVACDGGDTSALAVAPHAQGSVHALAAVVAREAGELARADVVTVVRCDDCGDDARVVTRWSAAGAWGPSTHDAVELAAAGAIHREPRRIVLPIRAVDGLPSASGLVLPLLAGDVVWGALVVTHLRTHPLRRSTERQLATLAELASFGLVDGEGRPRRRRSDVGGGSAGGVSREAIARRATDAASAVLGGLLVRMIALDHALPPAARVMAVASGRPCVRPAVALDVALVSAIGVGERSVRVADVAADRRFARVPGFHRWHGAASVPVAVGHDVRGAMTAYGDVRGAPTAAATRFLLATANVVAATLDRPRWGASVEPRRA